MATSKLPLQKPLLVALYGFPGAGKSYVGRNLSEELGIAHVNADRIRAELFEHPRFDRQENSIVTHLMNYMSEEFLKAGVSVIYDMNAMRINQRFTLRELARKVHAQYLLIWLQIDQDSAFARTQKRDRRTHDDRYAFEHNPASFNELIGTMQNPRDEDYLVISGKHTFATQKGAIMSRLYQLGIISSSTVQQNVAKPGLVNLVPASQAGRVDLSRRNITIR